jgi:hypothetical protein
LRDDLLRKSLTAIRVGWHLIRITPDHCDSAIRKYPTLA